MNAGDVLDSGAAGRSIIRGSALRVAGYVAGSLLSVIAIALLTRHLGPADFGRYAAVFSLLAIVAGLVDAGTTTLGVREHALRDPAGGRAWLSQLMGIRLALGAAGAATALGFGLVAGYDGQMIAGAALAACGLLLAVAAGTLTIPLQSALRLGSVTALELLRQAGTVTAIVALTLAGAGLVPLLGVPVPVGIVVLIASAALVRGHASPRPRADALEWRRLIALALPFATATTVGVIYAHVTVIVMSVIADDAQTGVFSAAFRVYYVLATIPGLLVAAAFPVLARAARDDRERLAHAVQRLLEVALIVGVGMALVTAFAAPAIIDVVAGADYEASADVLAIMALALLGTHLIGVGAFTLLALERFRALLGANAVGVALSAGLTIALAGPLDARGAAIAVVVGDVVVGSLYLVAVRRGPRGIALNWRIVAPVVAAAGVGAGLALAAGAPAVASAALAGIGYGAVILALRALPDGVVAALRP